MNGTAGRLGLFGGAFDPPHRTHVALARAAIEQLGLDRLLVLPTGEAWHKPRSLSAGEDRLAMTRLAFADLTRATVDDRELRRPGATYTVDTLRELQHEHPGAALFLVMGADQAAAFTGWREWPLIAAMATLCVAQRPGSAPDALPAEVTWRRLELPAAPDSATEIRARLLAGQDVSLLVPADVAGYIDQHHLYRTNR